MTDPSVRESWRAVFWFLVRPVPVFITLALLTVVGFGMWQIESSELAIPAPSPYSETDEPDCREATEGAEFCQELYTRAQRHSFTLQWVGWALTLAGGLIGLVAALGDGTSSDTSNSSLGRGLSLKNRAVLLTAIGGAFAAVGMNTVQRSADAADAAAEATRVVGELAVAGRHEQDGGIAESNSTPVKGDLDTAHDASVQLNDGQAAENDGQPERIHRKDGCAQILTPDRLAFRACLEIKAQWLSGRSSSSFLEHWQNSAKQ